MCPYEERCENCHEVQVKAKIRFLLEVTARSKTGTTCPKNILISLAHIYKWLSINVSIDFRYWIKS